MNRERVLKAVLVVVGLIFLLGVYPAGAPHDRLAAQLQADR